MEDEHDIGIDLNICIPIILAVNASYKDLLKKVRAMKKFTEREADVLDYIFRERIRLIIKHELLEEARLFLRTIASILHARHHHKYDNVDGINYHERWEGYKMIMEDVISVLREEQEFILPNDPSITPIVREFVERAPGRMKL